MTNRPNYEELYASFRWNIPARYSIAADVCDRHASDPDKIALIGDGGVDGVWRMTFRDVQRKAIQLANLLVSLGLSKGDRVMLLLGQHAWAGIGHVACWKAGLVSVPASTLFAPTPSPIVLMPQAFASSSPILPTSRPLFRRARWRR